MPTTLASQRRTAARPALTPRTSSPPVTTHSARQISRRIPTSTAKPSASGKLRRPPHVSLPSVGSCHRLTPTRTAPHVVGRSPPSIRQPISAMQCTPAVSCHLLEHGRGRRTPGRRTSWQTTSSGPRIQERGRGFHSKRSSRRRVVSDRAVGLVSRTMNRSHS
jgi:hypothetical protein